MRRFLPFFTLLPLTGCSTCNGGDGPAQPDPSTATHYRVQRVDLPETPGEVASSGFDLDGDLPGGDAGLDNALGFVYSAMNSADSFYETEAPSAARLGDDVVWVLTVYDDGARTAARLSLGQIVDGEAVSVTDGLVASGPAGGVLRGGDSELPLGTLTDALGDSGPGWLTVELASVAITSRSETVIEATFGAAVVRDDLDPILVPNLAAFFSVALAAGHSDYGELVDRDGDGVVTDAELRADSTFRTMTVPDIYLDEVDNAEGSLSLGFKVVATRLGARSEAVAPEVAAY